MKPPRRCLSTEGVGDGWGGLDIHSPTAGRWDASDQAAPIPPTPCATPVPTFLLTRHREAPGVEWTRPGPGGTLIISQPPSFPALPTPIVGTCGVPTAEPSRPLRTWTVSQLLALVCN